MLDGDGDAQENWTAALALHGLSEVLEEAPSRGFFLKYTFQRVINRLRSVNKI